MRQVRHLIVLSGNLVDGPLVDWLCSSRDHVIAADGGADHLRRLHIVPDLVVGDFDSLRSEGQAWIEENRMKVLRFPTAKNATDSEIALEASLAALPEGIAPSDVELVFLGALGSRPDHVLGNQMMAASLARQGYQVLLSDGISLVRALTGPGQWTLDLSLLPPTQWAVSVVSVSPVAQGLTYQGLRYPLDHFDLLFGSSRGISNEPAEPSGSITIRLESGTVLILLTPAY